jgi:alpha-mannosidase
MRRNHLTWLAFFALIFIQIAAAESAGPATRPDIDLSKTKTLYVVGYAHLDTQWRWAYPQVIREFVRDTMEKNFPLIEEFPHYVFNFSGSRRYEFMKEYYPQDYAKLKEYIAQGRWFPCGSSVDENDANVPSAESLIRQVLYGNHYFRNEFGVASEEYMLPDCFGFPYALPSVLAHCGIKGFSTQKLTWGSTVGIPFRVGVWEGPDGQSVIAALDPGGYGAKVTENLATSTTFDNRKTSEPNSGDFKGDYHYYGTGDRGGSPTEDSVRWIEKSVTTDGPTRVISGPSDWLFKTITPQQRANLPRYKGELLLTQHSAGSITSESFMKRMNRKNELLANSAESASVMAMWLGNAPYPSKMLYDAWDLVLGSQMHDILPGTSLPKAYEFSWNDELLAANQFASVLTDATGAVTSAMDTRGEGPAIAVYNPLSIAREDVVEFTIPNPGSTPAPQSVQAPDGTWLPVQILKTDPGKVTACFLAKVPPLSFSIYHASPNAVQAKALGVSEKDNTIESDRFKVTVDKNGDVSSIFDKKLNQEVLSAPARIAFMHEDPARYPAWNMDWEDQKLPPYAYVDGKPTIRVAENGPVRTALEVTREAQGSKFRQIIRLSAGEAGDRVEFETHIDWQTRKTALKQCFPFTAGNPTTSYGIQVGNVDRENDNEKKYEFPHHQWIDLTDASGKFGAGVLDDSKFGSDKPDDHTVRLTLVYTPGTRAGSTQDQGTQDIGRHEILYAVTSHANDWKSARTPLIGQRLNQPLLSFSVPSHAGKLGKTFSIASVNSDHVVIAAMKKAEDSDEIIVRLKEVIGEPAENVHVKFAAPVTNAREVDGQEREIARANAGDELVTDVGAFRMRAFAIELGDPAAKSAPAVCHAVDLPFDSDVISTDANRADGAFDSQGRTYPAEQLPAKLTVHGVEFKVGDSSDGAKNAITCRGQSISIPSDGFERAYLIAAADGDQNVSFDVAGKPAELTIQNWTGYVGQWDNRQWLGDVPELASQWHNPLGGLVPGFVKPATVAWFATHRHHPTNGNEYYQFSYLYKYAIDLPPGTTSIKLPQNDRVKILAMTFVKNDHNQAVPLKPLHDTLKDHTATARPAVAVSANMKDVCNVTLSYPLYWRDGGLHYTLDGTEPTEQSPVYTAPIALYRAATIKAKSIIGPDQASQTVEQNIPVNDVTPPTVKTATAFPVSPMLYVWFSEPVEKQSAETATNYSLAGDVKVESAKAADDGKSAV